VHFIISLRNELKTMDEYAAIVRATYYEINRRAAEVGSKLQVDFKCKNPSRLTRAPGFKREGVIQEILELKPCVINEQLEEFLGLTIETLIEMSKQVEPKYTNGGVGTTGLHPNTKMYLMVGAQPGSRNDSLYSAACDMYRNGFTFDDICDKVKNIADLPEGELARTVRSAEYRQGD